MSESYMDYLIRLHGPMLHERMMRSGFVMIFADGHRLTCQRTGHPTNCPCTNPAEVCKVCGDTVSVCFDCASCKRTMCEGCWEDTEELDAARLRCVDCASTRGTPAPPLQPGP